MQELESKLNELDKSSQDERSKLSHQISVLQTDTHQFKEDKDNANKIQTDECNAKMKDIFLTPTEEDFFKEFEKDEILANQDAELEANPNLQGIKISSESELPESGIITKEKEWFKGKGDQSVDYDKPRSFTLNQIKDLVYLHLSRSDFKKRFVSQNNLLKFHEEALEEISTYRTQLGEDLKNSFEEVNKDIDANFQALEEYKTRAEKTHKDMQERITSNFKKCMDLQTQCDGLKGFQDIMNNKM